jgi:hypothetical protein
MMKLAAARNVENFTNLPLIAWEKFTLKSGGCRIPKPIIFYDTVTIVWTSCVLITFWYRKVIPSLI